MKLCTFEAITATSTSPSTMRLVLARVRVLAPVLLVLLVLPRLPELFVL